MNITAKNILKYYLSFTAAYATGHGINNGFRYVNDIYFKRKNLKPRELSFEIFGASSVLLSSIAIHIIFSPIYIPVHIYSKYIYSNYMQWYNNKNNENKTSNNDKIDNE